MKAILGLGLMFAFAQSPEPPTFRSEVRAVEVDVFVSHDDQPLAGLAAGDFELLDNGVRQEVTLAAGPGAPVNAILLLDTSASVGGERLAQLKAAGAALLDGLAPGDHATLLTFSHEVRAATAPSDDLSVTRRALEAATAGGGTALFDAVYAALQSADRRWGRPIVLVFSDGEDRLSWLSADQVRAAAREADLVMYAVGLTSRPAAVRGLAPYLADTRGDAARRARSAAGRDASPASAEPAAARRTDLIQDRPVGDLPAILKDLTELTGGQLWRADGGPQLREAFLNALREAKSRYLLQYEPRGVEGTGWHELQVRLKGKRGKIRARRGYHDGAR